MPLAVIELPRGGLVKRSAGGRIDFVSPLPCPYNYGSLPGTRGGDDDPIDAIVLGPRLRAGTRVDLPVVAAIGWLANHAMPSSTRPTSAERVVSQASHQVASGESSTTRATCLSRRTTSRPWRMPSSVAR